MVKIKKPRSPLQKLIKRGFKGFPVATVAYYGPDNKRATKVAVGITPSEDADPIALERWFTEEGDIRRKPLIEKEIIAWIKGHEARTIFTKGDSRIIGCPHEEGQDYPSGEVCPECSYWADKDRWTGDKL